MSALRKHAQRGYTVVEVLATMTLFAIGASGVISMQKVTIQGGDDARHFDIATNIANQWAGQLQRDSLFWTLPDSNDTSSNLGSTLWLKDVDTGADWHRPEIPSPLPAGAGATWGSSAYNLLGHEVAPDGPDAIFCVQIREKWIVPPPSLGAFMRAEIRVVWGRLESPIMGACGATADYGAAAVKDRYHFVYVTTAIRENPAR